MKPSQLIRSQYLENHISNHKVKLNKSKEIQFHLFGIGFPYIALHLILILLEFLYLKEKRKENASD